MDTPHARFAIAAAAAAAFTSFTVPTTAQPTSDSPLSPPPNSVRRVEPADGWHALVGATVHVSPGRTIERATVMIRNGRIVSVGEAPPPVGAQVRDAAGLHVYAGFIEPYLEVEVPRPDLSSPGAHWNPRVTPQRTALDRGSRGIEDRTGQTFREMGFTAAAISPRGGIFRGRSAVVSLARPSGDPSAIGPRVYRDAPYQAVSFETSFVEGVTDPRAEITPDDVRWSNYPNSQMGAIALIRQTLSDADWQRSERLQNRFDGPWNALDWLVAPGTAPEARSSSSTPGAGSAAPNDWSGLFLFDCGDELEALRAAKIGREFSRPVAVLGSGREYRRLEALVEDGVPVVLPLNFPRPPQVETIGEVNATELDELIHWEQAPTNPRRVAAALAAAAGGARSSDVSLTTSKGQPSRASRGRRGAGGGSATGPAASGDARDAFMERLGTAIKHGLSAEQALAMLTVNPARLLGVEGILGTVEPGKHANIVVADGPLFMDRPDPPRRGEPGYRRPARVIEVWIDGIRHEVRARPDVDIRGKYEVTMTPPLPPEVSVTFNIAGDDPDDEPEFTITKTTAGDAPAVGRERPAPPDARPADARPRRAGRGGGGAPAGDGGVDIRVRNFQRSGPGLSRFTFSFDHEPFGEKGVFQNSGVIERLDDGTVVLHGDSVRSSGARMRWTARRIGPADPRKPSLAGAWPLVGDGGGGPAAMPAIVLVFDRGNLPTVQPPPGMRGADRADGRPAGVENFRYDGRTITCDFDASKLGMPGIDGVWSYEATVDWSRNPPRMTGTATSAAGERQSWTAHRRDRNPFAGEWRVTQIDGQALPDDGARTLTITIGGSRDQPSVRLTLVEPGSRPVQIDGEEEEIRLGKLFFRHDLSKLGQPGVQSSDEITVNWSKDGPDNDVLVGLGRLPDGEVHPYEARRTAQSLESDRRETAAIAAIPENLGLPVGAYAVGGWGGPERAFITGATIWTCRDGTPETVIENGAVVIADGKILYVGPSAGAPRLADGFVTIDATGKFITPGIIDCHSHTGISRGVNESGQAVTAEVRIGDVTDPDNVSWYRQLAGGVTCVNNLHGSANAIGGQSMVNKIRWGCRRPDDMHFEGDAAALPGIKFALGENPKQSNWGDRSTTRYPQTRMGVEMLIRDRFTAAREYRDLARSGTPPRRDLELEALAEVLDGRRLVHCHSYRQDEILMLCRVARDFGFRIGTFQHILEGYKVADEMVKWSGGGSAFSDWWAYKWEVFDAIPAAGPLMHEQGVIVSFNSDSDEMARRLNVEAGKAAKYSGRHGGRPIPPHEAFKFVTLNPAKQLRIDQWTGSLEAGKDADLAIWSGVPISPTSRCEATWVDGRRVFSLEQDAAHRRRIASERARLVQKVLAASGPRGGAGRGRSAGDDDEGSGPVAWSASDDSGDEARATTNGLTDVRIDLSDARASGRRLMLLDALQTGADRRRDLYMNVLLRGLDPRWMRAGDCGCGMTGGEQ